MKFCRKRNRPLNPVIDGFLKLWLRTGWTELRSSSAIDAKQNFQNLLGGLHLLFEQIWQRRGQIGGRSVLVHEAPLVQLEAQRDVRVEAVCMPVVNFQRREERFEVCQTEAISLQIYDLVEESHEFQREHHSGHGRRDELCPALLHHQSRVGSSHFAVNNRRK